MSLIEQIQQDITAAMKAREEQRLSTLRMVKSALKNRQIEKMAPLDEKESQAVLATLIKQRKESVEQFTKGGRQEMADKEAAEIVLIETYMPKAAGEAEIVAGVKAAIAEMGAPTMKEMGTVMKNAMAKFNAAGMRVDGKMVSEMESSRRSPLGASTATDATSMVTLPTYSRLARAPSSSNWKRKLPSPISSPVRTSVLLLMRTPFT